MAGKETWYTLAVKFEDDNWYKIEACAPDELSAEIMAKTKASCEGHKAREVMILKKPVVGPDDWRYYG